MNVKRIHIKNFKSVVDLSLELASVNVFIGENGSGKSNILEALAFAAAAAADKADNEFLVSRGIRVTEPRFMRSAFAESEEGDISIEVEDEKNTLSKLEIATSGEASYPKWSSHARISWAVDESFPLGVAEINKLLPMMNSESLSKLNDTLAVLMRKSESPAPGSPDDYRYKLIEEGVGLISSFITRQYLEMLLAGFIIYYPETTALRTFEKEGQILPLGVRGEGLLKLLRVMANEDGAAWSALQQNLELLDWLLGIDIDQSSALLEQSLRIRDRFVAATLPPFDQRSANEGFLYLLFFFALILSKSTPRFFAIENVDTSLNPKACSELMRRISSLVIEREKQVLLTTHNPSILDGLNLHDEKQRLFVVSRNKHGHTVARRVTPPKPIGDELPIRLSEAFVRGLLGGIPQNF